MHVLGWQPRDCTFETDKAPNSRSHCPRYVTFPSYKPSGELPFHAGNRCYCRCLQNTRENIFFFTPNFASFFAWRLPTCCWTSNWTSLFAVAVLANATEGIRDQAIGELHEYGWLEFRPWRTLSSDGYRVVQSRESDVTMCKETACPAGAVWMLSWSRMTGH